MEKKSTSNSMDFLSAEEFAFYFSDDSMVKITSQSLADFFLTKPGLDGKDGNSGGEAQRGSNGSSTNYHSDQ